MYEFNATEFLVRLAENNAGKILGFAVESASKLKTLLSTNYSAYLEAAFERCSRTTTIFDRSKSIPLESIYVRTYLDYQGKETSDQKLFEFVKGIHATSEVRTFLVIGSGGTGKTLLFRWLFLRLIEGQSARIPLLVELRGINYHSEVNLLSFIYDTMVQRRGRASFDAFLSAVADGRFIFMLDGLDEIEHDKRREIIRQIMHLQERHPGLLFIISSRPDETLRSWGYAHHYGVLPLKKSGTLSLISKLPYKPSVKKAFRDDVDRNLYDRHTSFLSNPLLINIMLLTYGDLGDVPAKMHIFYEQAFETLFFRHDTWKDVGFQRKHHCNLSVNEFRDCLSALCIASYKRSQHEFSTTSVLDLIKRASEYERIVVDAYSFLKDAEESVCILQLDGLMYKFTHRSFQEYFAAVFIARGPAIKLADLLDSIAMRRGDRVIPMALDMNRSLLEREWLLPRLDSLPGFEGDCSHILAFANDLFGGLTYCKNPRGDFFEFQHSRDSRSFIYLLRELYPDWIDDFDNGLQMTGDDTATLKRMWMETADQIWTEELERSEKSDKSETDDAEYCWPSAATAARVISRRLRPKSTRDGALSGSRHAFLAGIDAAFLESFAASRRLGDQDASWFQVTLAARSLENLRANILALREHIGSSLRATAKIGTELLD